MRIYYKLDRDGVQGSNFLTKCKYKLPMVGSNGCKRCEHNNRYDVVDKWVDCAKETGMKVETATLQFIRDDEGVRHYSIRDWDYAHECDIEDLYKIMVERGEITPNPLEKALDALDKADRLRKCDAQITWIKLDDANKIIRTLFEEME